MIYRPETERESPHFQAVLPEQFDKHIWFDRTSAVTTLGTEKLKGLPNTIRLSLPELEWKYGYAAALGSMVALDGYVFCRLRKAEWL